MTIKTIADPFMNEEIEAVIICSSTNTHAQFIIEAAKAGKHFFCEKPIDYDLARVHEAISTAKLITPEGSRGAEMYSIMFDRYTQAFVSEMQAFARAVADDTETPVTGDDGLYPVRIAAAAALSLKEQRPVKLSEIEG